MNDMTDRQVIVHLRDWVKGTHMPFEWPTDACGYKQHIRFVEYRNKNWNGSSEQEFNQFILDYADLLERKQQ